MMAIMGHVNPVADRRVNGGSFLAAVGMIIIYGCETTLGSTVINDSMVGQESSQDSSRRRVARW
jgi:hypothetical protein